MQDAASPYASSRVKSPGGESYQHRPRSPGQSLSSANSFPEPRISSPMVTPRVSSQMRSVSLTFEAPPRSSVSSRSSAEQTHASTIAAEAADEFATSHAAMPKGHDSPSEANLQATASTQQQSAGTTPAAATSAPATAAAVAAAAAREALCPAVKTQQHRRSANWTPGGYASDAVATQPVPSTIARVPTSADGNTTRPASGNIACGAITPPEAGRRSRTKVSQPPQLKVPAAQGHKQQRSDLRKQPASPLLDPTPTMSGSDGVVKGSLSSQAIELGVWGQASGPASQATRSPDTTPAHVSTQESSPRSAVHAAEQWQSTDAFVSPVVRIHPPSTPPRPSVSPLPKDALTERVSRGRSSGSAAVAAPERAVRSTAPSVAAVRPESPAARASIPSANHSLESSTALALAMLREARTSRERASFSATATAVAERSKRAPTTEAAVESARQAERRSTGSSAGASGRHAPGGGALAR